MKRNNIIILFLVLTLLPLTTAAITTGVDGVIGLDLSSTLPTFNNNTAYVNNSEFWDGNAWSDTRWLNIDGSNANQNVDIGENFYAGEGTLMYEYLDQSGGNQLFAWNVAGLSRENKWSSPSPFKILNTVEIYDGSNNPVLTTASNVDVGLSSMTSTNPYLRISGYDSDAKVAKTGTLQVDVNGNFNILSATGEILSLNANGENVVIGASTSLNTLTIEGTSTALTNWQTLSMYSTTAQTADAGAGIMWGGTYKDASADIAGFASMAGRKENSISNNIAGYIQFGTRPNGGSVTERMRIDSAGNMIVGGTSANNIFEASSVTDATAQITRVSTTAGHYSELAFSVSTDNTLIASSIRNTRLVGGEGRLGLFVSPDATEVNLTEYLSIFSNGNVDIVAGNLNVNGSLNQTNGNATINLHYAEGWGMDIGEVAIASAGVYYNVTNFSMGLLNGFTFNADGGVTPDVGGVYKVTGSWSFSGSANNEYHIAVAKNNVVQEKCHAERVIGTGGDVGSATTSCLLTLAIGDYLNAQIENIDGTGNPTIHNINFNIVRIGN